MIIKIIPKLDNFTLPKRYKSSKKQNYKALVNVIDFFNTVPKVNRKKCRNCNVCVESCPVRAINKDTKQIDYKVCIECMCCHERFDTGRLWINRDCRTSAMGILTSYSR